MTATPRVDDGRRQNAEWLAVALQLLRLRLCRHAAALGAGANARRGGDWLVADAARERSEPAAQELALASELGRREASLRAAGGAPALCHLVQLAELDGFERELLLLAAAPSLDGAFARLLAELHFDVRRDHASLHLALSLFAPDVADRLLAADCLTPSRALRRLRIVEVEDDASEPLLTRRLRVDERIGDYLRGLNRIDTRVAAIVMPVRGTLPSDGAARAAADATRLVAAAMDRWSTVNLVGGADGSAREAARLACDALRLEPRVLDLERFAACSTAERAVLIALLGREALLAGMALIVDAEAVELGSPSVQAIGELVAQLPATLFLLSAERWPAGQGMEVVRLSLPTRREQCSLWRAELLGHPHSVNGEVEAIVQQFDFGVDAITDVVSRVAADEPEISGRALWAGCREHVGVAMAQLAGRIPASHGWDDIVVSDDVRNQLRELAAQVQHRSRVYEAWGFGGRLGRGRGITALFAGPSGTGKTMAAGIVAAHLELDLYRIDLAGVVSKYVGETEKNLRRVFDAAERSGAILFFDEADALFGNRTEVRDSHDRYANLEVNYLLQRMEDYGGLAILATNRRAALDAAFLRRLRFVIEFPFPAPDDRRRIWERAFPATADVGGLDLARLSSLDLSGGNIRSIAVNAAFLAAADGAPIGMMHVMRAAAREYVKLSKPIDAAEFGPYFGVVRR